MKKTSMKRILLATMVLVLFPFPALAIEQYVIAEMFVRTDENGTTHLTMEPPQHEKPFWIRIDGARWMTVRGVPEERIAELLQKHGTSVQPSAPETKPIMAKSDPGAEPANLYDGMVKNMIEDVKSKIEENRRQRPKQKYTQSELKTLLGVAQIAANLSSPGQYAGQAATEPSAPPPREADDDEPSASQRFAPPPPIFQPSAQPSAQPRGAIDITTGQFFSPAAGGVIDPRTGTFHVDTGAGFIDTRTGQFSPKIGP